MLSTKGWLEAATLSTIALASFKLPNIALTWCELTLSAYISVLKTKDLKLENFAGQAREPF